MNKNFKKLAVLALAGLTLCGTAVAAPRPGRHAPAPAPMHHRAPAPHHHTPPPPRHHVVIHHEYHDTGLVTLGAVAIGGLIGALIGACN